MAQKSDIFISHVSADRKLARALQQCIQADFNSLSVFVSSDGGQSGGQSIEAGEWFKQVKSALLECKLAIVLCSPLATQRAWVAFEAGAAWSLKGVKVALLCHSHMRPGGLPSPYSQLQAMEVDAKGVAWLYEQITKRFSAIKHAPPTEREAAAVRLMSRAESEVIVERNICAQINAVMALSYRDDPVRREFLLVRTNSSERWTFPKGSLEKVSDISDYQRYARNELLEESGAAGEVFENHCEPFQYVKSNGALRWVLAFAARVDKIGVARELSRTPKWCGLDEARELLARGRDGAGQAGLHKALDFVAAFKG